LIASFDHQQKRPGIISLALSVGETVMTVLPSASPQGSWADQVAQHFSSFAGPLAKGFVLCVFWFAISSIDDEGWIV